MNQPKSKRDELNYDRGRSTSEEELVPNPAPKVSSAPAPIGPEKCEEDGIEEEELEVTTVIEVDKSNIKPDIKKDKLSSSRPA